MPRLARHGATADGDRELGMGAVHDRRAARGARLRGQNDREGQGDDHGQQAHDEVGHGGHSSSQLVRSAHVPPFDL